MLANTEVKEKKKNKIRLLCNVQKKQVFLVWSHQAISVRNKSVLPIGFLICVCLANAITTIIILIFNCSHIILIIYPSSEHEITIARLMFGRFIENVFISILFGWLMQCRAVWQAVWSKLSILVCCCCSFSYQTNFSGQRSHCRTLLRSDSRPAT